MQDEVRKAIETITAATASCAAGDRHIAVLDRGWIFAGDMSFDPDTKTYTMTSCVNVRKWQLGGFGALSKGASNANATLDECAPIRFHTSALILAVPIGSDWNE